VGTYRYKNRQQLLRIHMTSHQRTLISACITVLTIILVSKIVAIDGLVVKSAEYPMWLRHSMGAR
jgi:hypothetical protein